MCQKAQRLIQRASLTSASSAGTQEESSQIRASSMRLSSRLAVWVAELLNNNLGRWYMGCGTCKQPSKDWVASLAGFHLPCNCDLDRSKPRGSVENGRPLRARSRQADPGDTGGTEQRPRQLEHPCTTSCMSVDRQPSHNKRSEAQAFFSVCLSRANP